MTEANHGMSGGQRLVANTEGGTVTYFAMKCPILARNQALQRAGSMAQLLIFKLLRHLILGIWTNTMH